MRSVLGKICKRIRDFTPPFTRVVRDAPQSISDPTPPQVFNAQGEPIAVCYLQDKLFAHSPYGSGADYILWDRFNHALPVHFYTHDEMLHCVGKPTKRYGWLIESEAILPHDYQMFKQHPGLHQDFDAIFTHSDVLLRDLPNARFAPPAFLWYGTRFGGGLHADAQYEKKTRLVSFVSSGKAMCLLHEQRLAAARYFLSHPEKHVDVMGTIDGGKSIHIAESLSEYAYSVIFENYISSFFFTEKILNCFASMTVPIYWGASKISDFFNPDGILQLKSSSPEDVEAAICQCSEADYHARLPAIKENYQKVFTYRSGEYYIRKNYLDLDNI